MKTNVKPRLIGRYFWHMGSYGTVMWHNTKDSEDLWYFNWRMAL